MLDYDKVTFQGKGFNSESLTKTLETKEKYVSTVEGLISKYKTEGTHIEPAAYSKFLDSDVAMLSVSIGIITSLKSNGLNTIGQLMQAKDADLLRIRNIGVGKIKHIKTALEAFKAGFKS